MMKRFCKVVASEKRMSVCSSTSFWTVTLECGRVVSTLKKCYRRATKLPPPKKLECDCKKKGTL